MLCDPAPLSCPEPCNRGTQKVEWGLLGPGVESGELVFAGHRAAGQEHGRDGRQ